MPVKFSPWSIKDGEKDLWGVKLLEGEFAGTIISIHSLEMQENSDGEIAVDFNVIEKPPTISENDIKSEKFNNVFSKIINHILKQAIDDYENRDSNSRKSN